MLKKIFSSKRGEVYIDVAISVIALVMFMVLALNIFSAVTLKTHMDRIAEDLLAVATYTGEFGDDFEAKVEELKEQYFDFEVGIYADEYHSSTLKRVQLGGTMVVTITVDTSIAGQGVSVPLSLTVQRVGQSEQFWK